MFTYALLSVIAVSLISLIGTFTLTVNEQTLKKFLIYFISFSAGALFGDAFIHLIPEAYGELGLNISVSLSILAGIASAFLIEKIICWRHCHMPITKNHVHRFAYMNLVGDAIHNLIDGLTIGASYLISVPTGIATTLAVFFHEVPQEISDFGVLIHGGFSRAKAIVYNFLTALTALLGVLLAFLLASSVKYITPYLIAFAAGNFIYIAGSDLIPELHKEDEVKKGIIQLAFFALGIGAMLLLLFYE